MFWDRSNDRFMIKKLVEKYRICTIDDDLVYPDEDGKHWILTKEKIQEMIKEILREEDFVRRNYV